MITAGIIYCWLIRFRVLCQVKHMRCLSWSSRAPSVVGVMITPIIKGGNPASQRLLVLVLVPALDFVQSCLFLRGKVLFIFRMKLLFLSFPFSLCILLREPHEKSRAGCSLGSGGAGPVWCDCQTTGVEPTQLEFSEWNKGPRSRREAQILQPTNVCLDGSYSSGGGRLECEAGHPVCHFWSSPVTSLDRSASFVKSR